MTESESARVCAVDTLIETLRGQYPRKGFALSEKLRFVHTPERGVSITAKRPIHRDETLVVLPESSRMSSIGLVNSHKKMKALRNKLKQNAPQRQNLQSYLEPEDFMLALAMMKALSLRCRRDALKEISREDEAAMDQAATWPTEDEMRTNSWFYWDLMKVKKVWNKSGLWFAYLELKNHVQFIFNHVLHPFFKSNDPLEWIDTSLPSNVATENFNVKKKLYNTFLYAISLAWSRSHQDEHGHPDMLPLIELFNGHSERIDQGKKAKERTVINVDIARGFWPFVGGDRFINECNLGCSCVYANRNIDEGEELILSFGDVSPTGFVAKYGHLPPDFLDHPNIMCDVSLWTPPEFIPSEPLRVECLEKSNYPLEKLRELPLVNLQHLGENLELYRQGYDESEMIKSMRQYLVLAVLADEFELDRNLNTGRLRGPLYESKVMLVMCRVVDHNIKLLSGGATVASAEDAERASRPETPAWERSCLLARAAYRECLLAWRFAFARRGEEAARNPLSSMFAGMIGGTMGDGDEDCAVHDAENALNGCRVCGRSYPAKRCARCGEVKYCSRGHQVQDWKEHKIECRGRR